MSSKNSFPRNSVTYGTPCHVIGHYAFWCHHVTYKTPCYTSGHLVIYCEGYRFERAFFTLRCFLPYTLSCCFQGFAGIRQFSLIVRRTSRWSSKHSPGPTICLNYNNPQKRSSGRLYFRAMTGHLHNEESAPCRIRTLLTIAKHVQSHMVYPLGYRAIQFVIN